MVRDFIGLNCRHPPLQVKLILWELQLLVHLLEVLVVKPILKIEPAYGYGNQATITPFGGNNGHYIPCNPCKPGLNYIK